ncbi:MAG: CoA transferase [Candidatus Dormibacteraeota bacterium]|nr:CoA transferase [Candidatus Dormibacteraeota bacterium]MBV9525132.1 CoA transferase [Candidatus Dormibacteraeota bacterium]
MTALDDVRVLDLSRLLPGPFCTLLLADLGADVIKVEDTESGDYLRWMPPLAGEYSAMFHPLNRNKRSVSLNLKTAPGREAFLRLADTADVVLESFRPGVMDRLQLGWDVLHARNPRLILCSISGYGQDGPYRDRAGHDLNYAALAGVLSLSAGAAGEPAMPGVQAGDLGAGALHAAVAILAALHQRARTGEGQRCDIAMLDGLVSWMTPHAALYFAEGEVPRANGITLNGRNPCYRIYACADGHLSLGALEPKFWRAFVEAIGLPHLAESGLAQGDEGRRVSEEVEAVLRTRTRAEWSDVLAGRDVCCEPLLTVDETFANEQVLHRGMRLEAGEAGPTPQCGAPIRMSASAFAVRRRAPGYGEHTREVLRDAGYDAASLDALVAEGAAR